MKRICVIACLILPVILPALASAADPAPAAPPLPRFPPPTDEDLQRVSRMPCKVFPWIAKPPALTGGAGVSASADGSLQPSTPAGTEARPTTMSGDILVSEMGEFAFTDGPQPCKQLLTLNKQVEIEQIATKSVMRAEKFNIVIDQASGNTDLIKAQGGVQFVQPPDQKGLAEFLTRETKFGPSGEPLIDLTTLEGNRSTHTKATVWQGPNVIEAERIVNDGRFNTFRAMGNPAAVMTSADAGNKSLGAAPTTAPLAAPKPPTEAVGGSGSMMPGIDLSSGGVTRMQCDGELFYEGAVGGMKLTRNVLIQKGDPNVPAGPAAITIACDDASLVLEQPPMGQPDAAGQLFSGTPKLLTCNGRVELKTSTHTILCDRGTFDLIRNSYRFEMKKSIDDVRIYARDGPTTGQLMLSQGSLSGNSASNDFKPAVGMRYGTWPAVIPTNRPTQPKEPQ